MNNRKKQQFILSKIVIAHYFVAAFTFLALAPMLLWNVDAFAGHYFQPHLLAITHTAALGWATVLVFGICYQLIPIVFKRTLYSKKLAWLGLLTFYVGMLDLVYAFWIFEPGLHMQCGSILLLTGISLFCINVFLTTKQITEPNIYQDFIATSCVWLVLTAVLGVLMVFNFSYAFLPQDHVVFLRLHAHAGLVGWFLLLIIGLSSRFLSVGNEKTTLLKSSYYLINSGLLLFLINTYLFGINHMTWFIAVITVTGMACWFVDLSSRFKFSGYAIKNVGINYLSLAFGLLWVAVLVLPFIIFYHLKGDALAIRLTTIYGSLLLLGWLTSVILGLSFKTFQYAVYQKQDSDIQLLKLTSSPINIYNQPTVKLQFLTFLAFIISFTFGIFLGNKLMITIGLICFSLTAILYITHLFNLLFKTKSAY